MSAPASSLAQLMANQSDEDIYAALQLLDSLRPQFLKHLPAFGAPLRRYEGHLGRINTIKGFGFISSPDAMAEFGKDVFVSTNEIGNLQAGDWVKFTVIANKNHQPQARLVEGPDGKVPVHLDLFFLGLSNQPPGYQEPAWKEPAWREPAWKEQSWSESAWSDWSGPATKKLRLDEQQQIDATTGRYFGTIASFSEQSRFGFISSPRATHIFGKDVFLSSMELLQFNIGDAVSFDVTLNKNGQPQARNLGAASEEELQNAKVEQQRTSDTAPQPVEENMTRYSGTITIFTPDKHFGFISNPDLHKHFGKDIYVSEAELSHYHVGDTVSFRIVLNARGHPQARELGPADAADAAGGLGLGHEKKAPVVVAPPQFVEYDAARYQGTISAFTPEKHFGFIACPEIHQQFGKDTFVAEVELGGSYQVGDTVSFRVVLNARGHPQARELGPPGGRGGESDADLRRDGFLS